MLPFVGGFTVRSSRTALTNVLSMYMEREGVVQRQREKPGNCKRCCCVVAWAWVCACAPGKGAPVPVVVPDSSTVMLLLVIRESGLD